ncbi:MAG TPA: hypothetical protein VLT45_22140 [Kofleriaceae bacterium]|nr:hypothetical protein [Kofleriaceae bacterium]
MRWSGRWSGKLPAPTRLVIVPLATVAAALAVTCKRDPKPATDAAGRAAEIEPTA